MGEAGILLRKTSFLRKQVERQFISSRQTQCRSRPLIANSFPKSGTHLLTQILESLPGVTNYLTFLASLPSWEYRERSEKSTLRRIRRFVGGELVSAHLFHRPEYAEALRQRGAVHYFIYRDPRDVVCSEAHYLATMAPFHRLHRVFKRQPNEADRISLSILGDQFGACPVPFANIAERFEAYRGWLEDDDVCVLRFEDLVGPNQESEIRRICGFYRERQQSVSESLKVLTQGALDAINPERSHTYRKGGGVRNWEKRFTAEHKAQFKDVAGDLLVELGYENSLDW